MEPSSCRCCTQRQHSSIAWKVGSSDHLPGVINAIGLAVSPAQSTEVRHTAIAVQKSVLDRVACNGRRSNHLPGIIDAKGTTA